MHYLTPLVFKKQLFTKVKFLKRLNTVFFDSAIPSLHIYPREMKTFVHIRTSIQMFLLPLFLTAKKTDVHQLMNG